MLDATVISRRTSDSLNAYSRSKLSMVMPPMTRSLLMIGTDTTDNDVSVPGTTPTAATSACVSWTLGSRRETSGTATDSGKSGEVAGQAGTGGSEVEAKKTLTEEDLAHAVENTNG